MMIAAYSNIEKNFNEQGSRIRSSDITIPATIPYLRQYLEAFTAVQSTKSRLTPIPQRHILPSPTVGTRPNNSKGTTTTSLYGFPGLGKIELAGLLYDSTSTAFDAWEWTACLGAPAALVAGAVLVTLSETREDMAPRKTDKKWIRIVKQFTRFLLMSSFALEVVSIFVTTVTGTVLLSHGEAAAAAAVGYDSPLGLLHHHHEFEYLTISVGFLQGLIHWLAAAALEIIIPKPGEGLSSKRMNKCLASCLATLVFWILAFYNNHLTFYGDYFGMVRRFICLFTKRYLLNWPPRFMAFFYVPSFFLSLWFAWKAFTTPPELDNE
eukprot:scaffold742_cov165-Amphora_coffeaeformis.AAC.9